MSNDSIKVMTGGYGYTTIDDMDAKIDAARLEGIRLGLEAAARACLEKAEYFAHNDAFVVGQPLSNTRERYACVRCAYEIRNTNPDTIARDVQTSSHQSKCDNLHPARESTERRIKELVEESLVAARDREQLEAEIIEAMLGGTA